MNRLDAFFRDVPRVCPVGPMGCKWAWRRREQRWVLKQIGYECPRHWPAKVEVFR